MAVRTGTEATRTAVNRRPAWMDDESALREAAAEAYERLLEDGEWDDHRAQQEALNG